MYHRKSKGQSELARNPVNRRTALTTLSMFPLILPLDRDHHLRETNFSMAGKASADEIRNPVRSSTTPPARDPEIAVAEEYQAARQRGTAQALELFIARHPDSAYAEKARAELRRARR